MECEQRLQYIDPNSYDRQRCVFLFLQGCSSRGPGAQLSAGRWLSLSPTGLQNSIGGPEGPLGLVWLSLPHLVSNPVRSLTQSGVGLSLPHLISNFSGPQLIRVPSAGLSLPHLISNFSGPQLSDLLSWPSYIIVQRPLNRPLNLWNGMFDRHEAEITVMQFTGHSLPMHKSMSLPWDFLPCLISSAKSAHVISFDYLPLECVTSFRRITLEWHVWPGRRSKYNNSSAI